MQAAYRPADLPPVQVLPFQHASCTPGVVSTVACRLQRVAPILGNERKELEKVMFTNTWSPCEVPSTSSTGAFCTKFWYHLHPVLENPAQFICIIRAYRLSKFGVERIEEKKQRTTQAVNTPRINLGKRDTLVQSSVCQTPTRSAKNLGALSRKRTMQDNSKLGQYGTRLAITGAEQAIETLPHELIKIFFDLTHSMHLHLY